MPLTRRVPEAKELYGSAWARAEEQRMARVAKRGGVEAFHDYVAGPQPSPLQRHYVSVRNWAALFLLAVALGKVLVTMAFEDAIVRRVAAVAGLVCFVAGLAVAAVYGLEARRLAQLEGVSE